MIKFTILKFFEQPLYIVYARCLSKVYIRALVKSVQYADFMLYLFS